MSRLTEQYDEVSSGMRDPIECLKCVAGVCSHTARCPMMIRWYDDPWDGTFWRRCECPEWIIQESAHPVAITRVAKGAYVGDTDTGEGPERAHVTLDPTRDHRPTGAPKGPKRKKPRT